MNNDTTKKIDPADPFAGLEDAAEWKGARTGPPLVDKATEVSQNVNAIYEEKCEVCRGTGDFISYAGRYVGPCFKCKGTGKRFFKTCPETRGLAKKRYEEKKAKRTKNAEQDALTWLEAGSDEANALVDGKESGNEFCVSLYDALFKYGSLTEGQLNGLRKGIARKAEWAERDAADKAERTGREADAKLDLTGLLTAFASAVASGLKAPKLLVGDLRITRGKDNSKNPGFLYVALDAEYYEDRVYLGKINPAGEFFSVKACTAELFEKIQTLSGDVLAAARAHGAMTGNCSCCGRALTNEESVKLGIGPICRGRWGL